MTNIHNIKKIKKWYKYGLSKGLSIIRRSKTAIFGENFPPSQAIELLAKRGDRTEFDWLKPDSHCRGQGSE
ncbi:MULTISPECIES: hypothetical protein [Planktothricoides]|uniref:Uncharacterized protein n=2 Tax=Planktothricoides raciborskii TaxID=132608 RepID=A0AAU8JLJ6_9CYAN|nr:MULTISPECIES: hypothetical protein [Planktothricoides]MBD2545376.1 hypothetical protein [Planktothricoides raciborskii FACHB-1370]MBD2583199.1 hypothetical protein [Planktothricoides raciborskii FACHB-1261]